MLGFLSSAVKKEYDISSKVLGTGKFAVVRLATHRATKKDVAMKVIIKEKCKNESQLKKLASEIEIMKRVEHPNCIQFLEMFDSSSKLFIAMELVTGGELFDRIINKERYNELEAAHCFSQIMSALEYLHSIGIVHRDIKPENVLYATPDEDSPVKIADFGLGKIIDMDGDSERSMMTVCGTPSYLAPEVIQRKGYGPACDVWSAGVILYILLAGLSPFDQGASVPVLFNSILKAQYSFPDPYWTHISPEAKDLIRNMMVVDIKRRYTPTQVLKHKWMVGYKNKTLSTEQLSPMQHRLQEWMAAKKLKGAINTFTALLRMSSSVLRELPDEKKQKEILETVQSDPARMEILREAFSMLDRDRSGQIHLQNIEAAMTALGATKSREELSNMLRQFDVRKTGKVVFEDFVVMMGPAYYARKNGAAMGDVEMTSIFNAFDLQQTGTINGAELKEILHRLGHETNPDELRAMVSQADKNGDGVIDFEEFKNFMYTHVTPDAAHDTPHKALGNVKISDE